MMRSALIVFCVFCVATLLSEVLGLAFLWYRGQLNANTINEIRLALTGENEDDFDVDEEDENRPPSTDEVTLQRSMRILELNRRQEELDWLKRNVTEQRNGLFTQRQAFEKQKKDFDNRLSQIEETMKSDAAEQARGVLLALPPADAVATLMQLNVEEDIVLLKGMQEKSIAKILQQFVAAAGEQSERGRKIFEAISRGDPTKTLISETNRKLKPEVNNAPDN